jgi:hypothetical protein
MDEKFIQALGGSVDAGFVSLLRESTKPKMAEKVKRRSPKRSPRGGVAGGSRRRKSRKIRGGEISWMDHVRLTAGASKMCWKDAMREASKTWRY